MNQIHVFDPALCCSTGVCGPEVDETLVRFAGDVEWLKGRGVEVQRFGLAQEAAEFAKRPLIRATLQREGTECLPLVLRGEEILSRGRYPTRAELAAWSGLGEAEPAAGAVDSGSAAAPRSTPCCDPQVVSLSGRPPSGAAGSRCC
jgi:hypothetical protein